MQILKERNNKEDAYMSFFARLFKVSSPLGLQLDSLADMVTSGVVPGFVMFKMMGSSSAFMRIGRAHV